MDQQQIAKWERMRKSGMWRFVIVWTIALGVVMTAATALFDLFTTGSRPVLENMKIRAPIFLISAFLSGLVLWFVGQRKFRRSTEGTNRPEDDHR